MLDKMNDFQRNIWKNKYQFENETYGEWLDRISNGDKQLKTIMSENKFLFGGRILASRGLHKKGKKVTYSNCYVIPQPEDNIESIFDTAKNIARTFSYGGGVGIDISKLRPKGANVNNAAETTTGAVSFMDLFNLTTDIIGQKGRRGALMISMDVNHPDIEEFVDIKTDLEKITKANISVKVDDEFMQKVEENRMHKCKMKIEDTGETILKLIDAKKLFDKIVRNNWNYAEPGMLFWDTIKNNHFLSNDPEFEYAGVNPCAEEPLPAGGSCLLGSINLSEFVVNPFTDEAYFDFASFGDVVEESVIALNDVLDEGLELHPLEIQKETVSNYRQIGLGVMGIADMLIKLGMQYGKEQSLQLCDTIANTLLNKSVIASAVLAKYYGAYPKYNEELVTKTTMFEKLSPYVKELVKEHGLRNSQLLTIPPTGSISNLIGVSSGIEPIFSVTYTRKTESLHDESTYYEVYTPIIEELMKHETSKGNTDLPKYVVTSSTIDPIDRIKMQAIWQNCIDASISSTINLPYEAKPKDVAEIYINAWKHGLKGVTIYRDGCKREGVLTTTKPEVKKDSQPESKKENKTKTKKCSKCGEELVIHTGGCSFCTNCGHGAC